MAPIGSSFSTSSTSAPLHNTMKHKHNNTINGHITGTSGNTFGSYKFLVVGTSERMIRVPVPLPMSQLPYRKAMVVDLFFGTVKGLAIDSIFSSADLVVMIAGYFDFNTSSAEEEETVAVKNIRAAIFDVNHLTGLALRDHKGGSISFDPTGASPQNLTYFMASTVDDRGLDELFSVDFALRLPQTLVSMARSFLSNSYSTFSTSPSFLSPVPNETERLMTELGQFDTVDVDNLGDDTIRTLIKRSITTLGSAPVASLKRGESSDPAV